MFCNPAGVVPRSAVFRPLSMFHLLAQASLEDRWTRCEKWILSCGIMYFKVSGCVYFWYHNLSHTCYNVAACCKFLVVWSSLFQPHEQVFKATEQRLADAEQAHWRCCLLSTAAKLRTLTCMIFCVFPDNCQTHVSSIWINMIWRIELFVLCTPRTGISGFH